MWPHIRAVLITAHLVAVTLMSIPAPDGAFDRNAWKDPTVQSEFAAWAKTLDTTPEELEERVWNLSRSYMDTRNEVLAPFGRYYHYCGTGQSWRMFVAPHRHPSTLHIDIREGGNWRPVYIERAPQHRWLGRVLDSYRFRSVIFRFGWPAYEGEFEEFTRWIASRAAHDFPDAESVRVRLYKAPSPSPEEARTGITPAGEFTRSVELALGARP
ncbi:MAG: hypothetical protein L0241_16195 [Planctomycetia bacterium]|nr:hypothetical protein [Planctomycetia bacterium]